MESHRENLCSSFRPPRWLRGATAHRSPSHCLDHDAHGSRDAVRRPPSLLRPRVLRHANRHCREVSAALRHEARQEALSRLHLATQAPEVAVGFTHRSPETPNLVLQVRGLKTFYPTRSG